MNHSKHNGKKKRVNLVYIPFWIDLWFLTLYPLICPYCFPDFKIKSNKLKFSLNSALSKWRKFKLHTIQSSKWLWFFTSSCMSPVNCVEELHVMSYFKMITEIYKSPEKFMPQPCYISSQQNIYNTSNIN